MKFALVSVFRFPAPAGVKDDIVAVAYGPSDPVGAVVPLVVAAAIPRPGGSKTHQAGRPLPRPPPPPESTCAWSSSAGLVLPLHDHRPSARCRGGIAAILRPKPSIAQSRCPRPGAGLELHVDGSLPRRLPCMDLSLTHTMRWQRKPTAPHRHHVLQLLLMPHCDMCPAVPHPNPSEFSRSISQFRSRRLRPAETRTDSQFVRPVPTAPSAALAAPGRRRRLASSPTPIAPSNNVELGSGT